MKKITVIVIARNEELHIAKCIHSILNQSVKANRIIVLVHNSTDKTFQIATQLAKNLIIEVIPSNFGTGISSARLDALTHINKSDGYVLCIDGDAIAKKNWIKEMATALSSNKKIFAGSLVKFKGPLVCMILNIINWWHAKAREEKAVQWIWGCSYGFKAEYKDYLTTFLLESIKLQKDLRLTSSMEDYICAHYMSRIGDIEVIRNTCVKVQVKEKTSRQLLRRTKENVQNKDKLDAYFKSHTL